MADSDTKQGDRAYFKFVMEEASAPIVPINLLQPYSRTRALICLADNQDIGNIDSQFKELSSQKSLLKGPSLLISFCETEAPI